MSRGRFITFEGGEGAGKSTQARLLTDALAARGLPVIFTREPGGTAGAEAIRDLLLSNEGEGWGLPAEALLFAAARADHVARLIRPALERGHWVICDRFLDSSRAYQGGGGGLADADLLKLHRFGCGGLLPDRTLLLQVSPDTAADRLSLRDQGTGDRIGGRERAYHERVDAAFSQIAETEPERVIRIPAEGTPDEIHAQVLAAVLPLIEASS